MTIVLGKKTEFGWHFQISFFEKFDQTWAETLIIDSYRKIGTKNSVILRKDFAIRKQLLASY